MNENEWLTFTDPAIMLETMPDKPSDRKARLFAVACCKRISHLLCEESRTAIHLAEEFAEGKLGPQALLACLRATVTLSTKTEAEYFANQAIRALLYTPFLDSEFATLGASTAFPFPSSDQLPRPTAYASYVSVFVAEAVVRSSFGPKEQLAHSEYENQRHLLLDIFDNPFAPVVICPSWVSWNGWIVKSVAKSIFENAAFDKLAEVGILLSKAGCTDVRILNHCFSEDPHVRGCWVIDEILGKSD